MVVVALSLDTIRAAVLTLGELTWITLVGAVCIYSLDWLLRGLRWKLILPAEATAISVFDTASLVLQGNFANLAIPAKLGDALRVSRMKDEDVDKTEIVASLITDRLWDVLGVALIGLTAAAMILESRYRIWMAVAVCTSLVLLLLAHFVAPARKEMILSVMPSRLKNLANKLISGLVLPGGATSVFPLVLLSSVIWIMECWIAYVLAEGMGLSISFGALVVAVALANLTKALPLTPGGFGAYEATLGLAYSGLTGSSMTLALAIGLLDSFFKNGYTFVVGGVLYVRGMRR